MTTDQGRIATLLQDRRACDAAVALARARALRGGGPCVKGACSGDGGPTSVPQESVRLNQKAAGCAITAYTSPYSCVPESVRVERDRIKAEDCFAALGPLPRVFPAPCPVVEVSRYTVDENGNRVYYPLGGNISGLEPALQGLNCPLPNKPWNPVLPG